MEVVVDTCIFIDAIFNQLENEYCWEILHLIRKNEITPVVCDGLVNEYIFVPAKVALETLRDRFQEQTLTIKDFNSVRQLLYDCSAVMLKIIMDNSRHIAVKSNQAICDADPSDDKIINLAIDANCGTIVTKNISHFRCLEEKDVRTKKGRKIEVYTPQQFVDNFKLVRWASQSKAK